MSEVGSGHVFAALQTALPAPSSATHRQRTRTRLAPAHAAQLTAFRCPPACPTWPYPCSGPAVPAAAPFPLPPAPLDEQSVYRARSPSASQSSKPRPRGSLLPTQPHGLCTARLQHLRNKVPGPLLEVGSRHRTPSDQQRCTRGASPLIAAPPAPPTQPHTDVDAGHPSCRELQEAGLPSPMYCAHDALSASGARLRPMTTTRVARCSSAPHVGPVTMSYSSYTACTAGTQVGGWRRLTSRNAAHGATYGRRNGLRLG